MGAHVCIRLFLVSALFVMPAASYAVWICHTEDGRSWQQEHPPCKLPADVSTLSPAPQRGRPAQPPSRARQSQEPSNAPAAGTENIRALYDRAVSELEARYPVLNPDLPGFNGALAEQVLAQTETYVRQGYRKDYAVRAAAETVLAPRPSATTPAAQTTPSTQKQLRGTGLDIIDIIARGVVGGIALIGFYYAVVIGRYLIRALIRALHPRSLGRASAAIERTARSAAQSFQDGRRSDK